MKAAVLHQLGQTPKYEDYKEPAPQKEAEVVMTVTAAAIKNIDKGRASGQHYASHQHLPAVVGIDGVGVLEGGTRVYANGITGTMAEKALVDKNKLTKLPDGIDDITAAALPNAVLGADLALRYRARIQKGAVVLINGATGITGKIAVQLAKHYGAAKIIATGRNEKVLEQLRSLGADEIINLKQPDETIIQQIKTVHAASPIDIVIDYLWAHPFELIIAALQGGGGLQQDVHAIKMVTVGEMAGATIRLQSGVLRSSGIEILGSGFGSLPKEAFEKFNVETLPTMMQLVIDKKLYIDTEAVPLSHVEEAWQRKSSEKRIVLVM